VKFGAREMLLEIEKQQGADGRRTSMIFAARATSGE